MIKRLLILLALLLFASVGWGANWCVTPSGDNSDPTCATDCATEIAAGSCMDWSDADGTTVMTAGDTLIFSGSFTVDLDSDGDMDIGKSGTNDSNRMIFDGSDATITVSNTSGAIDIFSLNTFDWLELKDFTIRTGISYQPVRVIGATTSNQVKIHGFDMEGGHLYGFRITGSITNWEIYDNKFVYSGTGTQQSGDAILIYAGSDIKIHNNVFDNWRHGATGINALEGAVIERVEIYYNYYTATSNLAAGSYAVGMNEFEGSPSGINRYIAFHHNYIDGMRIFIQISDSEYVYVYGNIIANIKNCCESAGDDGCTYANTTECTEPNLEWYWKTGNGIRIGGVTPANIYIFNNTFHDLSEAAIFFKAGSGTIDEAYIYNNIIDDAANLSAAGDSPPGSQETASDSAIVHTDSGGSVTNWEIKNNIFNTDTGSSAQNDIYWRDDSTSHVTISTFEGLHASVASGNISVDPGFVAGNLYPDTGSQAIENGLLLSGSPYTDGFDGLAIPSYNEVIDPDQTDFTTTPPTVVLEGQPATWYIGAYGAAGVAVPLYPFQGAAGNFKLN